MLHLKRLAGIERLVGRSPWRVIGQGKLDFCEVYGSDSPDCNLVIKIPRDPSSVCLRQSLEFARQSMGGLLAPFSIIQDADIPMFGEVPFAVIQERLVVFGNRLEAMPRTYRGSHGDVDTQVARRQLMMNLVRRGILYPDAFIERNMGFDHRGQLMLLDFGDAGFASRTVAFTPRRTEDHSFHLPRNARAMRWTFYKSDGYDVCFNDWGLPDDDQLYELWSSEPNLCQPVSEIDGLL